MASFRAVAAVSRAVLRLLEDSVPRAEFPDAQFVLQQAADIAKTTLAEGVSLYLYRISINTTRRSLPPRFEPDGRQFRPAIPVDLYYALCVWGRNVDMQQRLLGFCHADARRHVDAAGGGAQPAWSRTSYVPQPRDGAARCATPLSLQDLELLWDSLKPNVPLFVAGTSRAWCQSIPRFRSSKACRCKTRVFEMRGGPV